MCNSGSFRVKRACYIVMLFQEPVKDSRKQFSWDSGTENRQLRKIPKRVSGDIVRKREKGAFVLPFMDALALVPPEAIFLSRQGVKAPLADQGELSRASPASMRLRGSELPSFCVLSLTQFDNPSVKNQRFLPAVHCGMTATGSHGNFDSLRGAPPFTQGSRDAPAPVRFSMVFGRTGRLPRFQRSRP